MNGYLAVALIVLAGSLGVGFGDWRRARYGRNCYAAALINHGVDEDVAQAEAYWWYRPDLDDLEDDDEPQDQVRDVPPAAGRELGDDGGGEGAPGVLAGSGGHPALALETSRSGHGARGEPADAGAAVSSPLPPGSESVAARHAGNDGETAGPGHARGYGPYLAAIGRDDPAGWYANLTAGEPAPAPGPRAEPAWVERLLHQGAISTAWCEATLHDTAEYFRADEAAVDYQIEQWVRAARFELVGSRSWPPPALEAVA